jgi:SAM-dependent methyltransferase
VAYDVKNCFLYRIHDSRLEHYAQKHLRGRLIDIGCGVKPYEQLLAKYVDEHFGVDHVESIHDQSNVDLHSTAYSIEVPDESFDCAICTAVLEHLEEPQRAIVECFRVLKPGGTAIYSVPFIWHLHEEPRDFFRYSRYGLDYLFRKAGFEVVNIEALSGFWFTFGQLLVYNLYRFNRGPLRWFRIVDGCGLAVQAIAYLADRLDKTEQWTWMYMVVARKPVSRSQNVAATLLAKELAVPPQRQYS